MTKFFHKLMLLFVGMSLIPVQSAFAEGTTVDGLNYILNTKAKTATLTYSANTANNYPELSGEVTVPATITSGGVEYTVTSIKYHAFRDCKNITKVILPPPISTTTASNSYTGYFFTGCDALEEVVFDPASTLTTIPANAFCGANALKTVSLPQSVTKVNDNAFKDCAALTTVNGLDKVTSFGTYVFAGCTSLETLAWPTGANTISNYTFYGCTSLKSVTGIENVTSVGTNAFQNCTSLESFAWPAGAKTLRDYTFNGCSSLQSITGTNNITSIGVNVFQNCTSLTTFAWPTSNISALRTISGYMFDGCIALQSVTGIDNVTTINDYAFRNCKAFDAFTFPALTTVGSYSFMGCDALTSVNFVKSTTIYSHAFEDCTALADVTFNPTMVSIGTNAFKNTGIVEITLPTHYTTTGTRLGSGVFEGCKKLTTVNIPPTTSTTTYYYFGVNGFKDCTALTTVNFINPKSSKATYFGGYNVFEGCTSLTDFTVPGNIKTFYAVFFKGANALKNLTISEGVEYIYTNLNQQNYTKFFESSKIEELVLPSTLVCLSNANSSTDYLFSNMPELRKVTLPATMTTLKTNYLFYNCPKLAEVVFPEGLVSIDGNYNFSKCGFTTLRFPDSLVHLQGQRNFADCTELKEVILGKNLSEIYASSATAGINTTNVSNTFLNCTALDKVVVPSGLKVLTGSYLFNGCPVRELIFEEPATIETIARNVFAGMTETTEITLPNSLRHLYWRAISQCPKLETVTFTAPLADDGVYDETFMKCESLKTVNMPDEFKAIGNRWFKNCKALTDFTMPRDLEKIGEAAFNTTSLRNLKFNEKLVELGDSCLYTRTEIVPVLPRTLKRIGSYNFRDNMNVTSGVFDMPGLEEIGAYAFYNCPITSIDLDKTIVRTVGTFAFYHKDGDSQITDIQFPATLETLGNSSIANCDKCVRLVFKSPVPPEVGNGNCAFGGENQDIYTKAKLYVPPMSYDAYRTTPHILRFFTWNNELRDNVERITDFTLSETEISRWLPCESETLTTTLKHLGEAIADYTVKWESTDTSVVTVSEDGTVTFVAPGTAFVHARYIDPEYGELTATCRVNVYDHLYDLTLDQPAEMYVGDTQTLTAHATMVPENVYVDNATYTWSTADESRLSTDDAGTVTAKEPGIVAVTATWVDPAGETHTAQRNVVIKPEYSVDFGDEHSIVMYVGDVTSFTNAVATFRGEPIPNGKLTWETADNTVTMVSSNGDIFGRAPGVTQIYAIYKGVKVPCTVTVFDKDMYNLSIYMPAAGGRLNFLGLKGDTEVSFAGDRIAPYVYAKLTELSHDDIDKLVEVYDNKYVVTGPLDTENLPESQIKALVSASGDVTTAMPVTELRVRYDYTLPTGIDNIDSENGKVFIIVNGNEVKICGADSETPATICDTTGVIIYTGLERTVTIGTPGIYVLSIGTESFQFIIK